jgi:hypothetical protein
LAAQLERRADEQLAALERSEARRSAVEADLRATKERYSLALRGSQDRLWERDIASNDAWKGIAMCARARGARFPIGCSSLTTQDATIGAAACAGLKANLAAPMHRTRPLAEFACLWMSSPTRRQKRPGC